MTRQILSSVFTTKRPLTKHSCEQLLRWAYQFSPIVAFDTSTDLQAETSCFTYGINLDVSTCIRVHKGEHALCNTFYRGLNKQELETDGISLQITNTQLALSASLGSAWALARYNTQTITIGSKQELRSLLSPLPISALRLDQQTILALEEVNITKIKHLFKLSRRSLIKRFEISLLERLDQALGYKEELITPITFSKVLKQEKIFNGVCTQLEAIKQAAFSLLTSLINELEKDYRKTSSVIIKLQRIDSPPLYKKTSLSLPSNNLQHIWNLMQPHIEKLQIGYGVISLSIYFPETKHIKGYRSLHPSLENSSTATTNSSSTAFAELLDSLHMHLGETRVQYLQCRPSHIPEQSFSWLPLSKENALKKWPRLEEKMMVTTERPSLLFYQPHQIDAMSVMPDSPPFWLKWQGNKQQIEAGIGPERIAPEWWGKDESLCRTRDYFKVQLSDGTWAWIFRELETMKWYIHGLWA